MVTSQLATRTLPEKKPVEVSVHATPTVEIRSASDHLTAVAGLVSVSGAGSDRQWDEAPQCGDRSELRRKVIHRSGRPSGTVIRRVIDDDTLMTAITLAGEVDNDDLREILPALQEFTQAVANFLVAAGGDVEPAMQSLAEKARAAEKLAIDMREDRGQHLTDGRSQTPLGRLRRLAEGVVRDVSRLIEAATVTAAAQQYTQQTEPATLAALGSGQAKHLMITPRPGTREALGAGQLYPDTVSTADRMQLALPASKSGAAPFTNLTLTGAQPPVLDVLAIGGGHGGVNATFEPDSLQESAFSKDYWKNTVVAPLVAKGVKADLIVLDACLTASMIDAFAPLCSAHGKIIASMYSINQKVMTPEIWAEVLGKASAERPAIIERRAQEVVRNADQASAAALFSKIKSAPSGDLEAALAIEPGLRNVVSGVRYLPKIVDAVQVYLRAKSQDRRDECLGDLDAIENDTPAADPRDAQVVLGRRHAARGWDGRLGGRRHPGATPGGHRIRECGPGDVAPVARTVRRRSCHLQRRCGSPDPGGRVRPRRPGDPVRSEIPGIRAEGARRGQHGRAIGGRDAEPAKGTREDPSSTERQALTTRRRTRGRRSRVSVTRTRDR